MNLGFPIELGEDIRKELGNVCSTGYVNHVIKDGEHSIVVDVGDMTSYPNLYEPPVMVYDSMYIDFMEAFKVDDIVASTEAATKIFEYELQLSSNSGDEGILAQSENNIEHCVLGDSEGIMQKLVDDHGQITMLNPSKGSLSRFEQHGLLRLVEEVKVLDHSTHDYKSKIKQMCDDSKIEYSEIDVKSLDKDKFYYVSFNGALGSKIGLRKYVGFEPNFYQLVNNGMCAGIEYNDVGCAVKYQRKDMTRTCSQRYREHIINRYGADSMYERYKNSKTFNKKKAMMHDVVASVDVFEGSTPIMRGTTNICNGFGLIGNYSYDGGTIRDSKGRIVYRNNMKNHSCMKLDRRWEPLDTDGIIYSRSSFIISSFSSVCVYLGEKFAVSKGYRRGADHVVDNRIYYNIVNINDDSDKVYVSSLFGDAKIQMNNGEDGGCCREVVVHPHCVYLWEQFSSYEYCFATYHTVVQRAIYNEDIDVDDAVKEFSGLG